MKICICFRGIHFSNDSIQTDFRKSFDHMKKHIIDPFLEQGDSVDILCLTYNSDILQELLDSYKPVDTVILDPAFRNDGDNWHRQLLWHIMSVDLIQKQNKEYDFIINTRFDFLFQFKSNDSIFDFNKFNILFQHKSGNCDDNYFALPFTLISNFKNACQRMKGERKITHEINRYLEGSIINYAFHLENDCFYEHIYKTNRSKI